MKTTTGKQLQAIAKNDRLMPISPPIRLRQLAEAFVIEDGDGTPLAYVYFDDDVNRRGVNTRC